jgi:hypothetical protein
MAQDGTATAIRPRHRRDVRGDGLRSGRHRQDGIGRVDRPHAPPQQIRPVPQVSVLAPATPVDVGPQLRRHEAADEAADVAAILPWLLVLGFLGLLGMVLTSLS